MSWGNCFFYYTCKGCGKKFKYAVDMISEFGDDFGKCPVCRVPCVPEKEGAVIPDDLKYEEVEE